MSQVVSLDEIDPRPQTGSFVLPAQRFGTFLGVYTPSLLRTTIFIRNAGEFAGNLI